MIQEIKYLEYIRDVEWTKQLDKHKKIISILKKLDRYALVFLIILLIMLPLWNFSYNVLLDRNMHKERVHVPGAYPPLLDTVSQKHGPTYDTEGALEEMEENDQVWLPDQVERYVDMEELTKFPGRLTLYRFRENRYLITYTYLAPYPITETYGFQIREVEGEVRLLSPEHNTLIYPNIATSPDDLI